jgi:diacylglycerol kinase family enzyme
LIVSVSGDGGYNEVVNGLMQAGNPRATSVVMAAGNANDHSHATQERPLADAVVAGDTVRIDLLRLIITSHPTDGGFTHTRYAHSYIGVGFTPAVAADLEKSGKGSLRELASVVRPFSRFRPFEIQLPAGDPIHVDSLLFANISQMAKVAKLSENGNPDDGRFEVLTIPHQPKWRLLATALKAATVGLGPQTTARRYSFTALTPMPPADRRRGQRQHRRSDRVESHPQLTTSADTTRQPPEDRVEHPLRCPHAGGAPQPCDPTRWPERHG